MDVIIVTNGTASEIAELVRRVKQNGCTVREKVLPAGLPVTHGSSEGSNSTLSIQETRYPYDEYGTMWLVV